MNIEKFSKYLLGGLIGISVLIFALFFFVGFGEPYEENPKMNAPIFTDGVLILMGVFVIVCLICMIGSFVRYIMEFGLSKSIIYQFGLPVAAIGIGLAIGATMLDSELLINNKLWLASEHSFDSLITDASMISIAILALGAIGVTIWSMVAKSLSK